MAKPPSAIGKAKKAAALQRRLDRGAKKLARRANRIPLNHQPVGGPSAPTPVNSVGTHPNTTTNQEHAA